VVVDEHDEAVAREHADRPYEARIRGWPVGIELVAVALVLQAVGRARIDRGPGQLHVCFRGWRALPAASALGASWVF